LLFLNYSFLGGRMSADITPTSIENINSITIQNGLFDDLFITKDVSSFNSPLSNNWDFNTIIHAKFAGNLSAGNVTYSASQVSSIRFKMRKKGTYTWTTIFEVPINSVNDLHAERFEKYAQSGYLYEFAIVPVINQTEGNMSINEVYSEFDGMFIMEKDSGYYTVLNTSIPDRQRNRPSSVVVNPQSKYPFINYNGATNYDSFTATGFFIKQNLLTGEFDSHNGYDFRDGFMDFLCDGKPKFLKYSDGRAWIIGVVDSPKESQESSTDMINTTFQCVQMGAIDSSKALFKNGLTDTSSESW